MDKFAELRAFAAVIEAGGFSAAARDLGQSRSAVNRLVISLEERLSAQLLHRTTRSISATSNGQALYERARQLLDDLDEIEAAISSAKDEPVGKLRLSVPPSFGDLDFSDLVAKFLVAYPRVDLDVSFDSRFVDPVAEGYDVVLRISEPDEGTSLVDHRLVELEYVLCASPSYLKSQKSPSRPTDLTRHKILFHRVPGGATTWPLDGPEGLEAIALSPRLTANNLETLLTAACSGLGIAILPAYAIRSELQAGGLKRVLRDHHLPPRMLQVIYPPARHLSAKVRHFTDFVESWCKGDDPIKGQNKLLDARNSNRE